MSRRAVLWFALVSVALGAGCATPADEVGCRIREAPARPAPLLWRAQAADDRAGALYLLGSVHVGGDRAPVFSAEVEAAYARSQELVVELDLGGAPDLEIATRMAERALLDPPLRIQDVLTPGTLARLTAYLEGRDFPFAAIEPLKPWYVTNLMMAMEVQSAGYDPEFGIDRHFVERSAGTIPIVALETAEQQIDLLDELPLSIQDLMLRDALERSAEFGAATEELMDAWWRGDEELLEVLVFQPVEQNSDFAAFYESIFFRRNASMSARLAAMSRDGKTRFVVLGTGHLLGPRGIPALLCEDGFAVERISGGGSRPPG